MTEVIDLPPKTPIRQPPVEHIRSETEQVGENRRIRNVEYTDSTTRDQYEKTRKVGGND